MINYNVKSIGNSAFTFCSYIENVEFDVSDEYVPYNIFDDFPEPITPFNDSFSESIIYLTKHHISILKYFFDELSDMQETLIDKLFTGLFFNIQTMNQYIFKYLHFKYLTLSEI